MAKTADDMARDALKTKTNRRLTKVQEELQSIYDEVNNASVDINLNYKFVNIAMTMVEYARVT